LPLGAFAAQTNLADQWVQGEVIFPHSNGKGTTNGFSSLHAEAVSGDLQIVWTPPTAASNDEVRVIFSADAPGHWPARDWRSLPMPRYGGVCKASVPVESVMVPLVYFIEARTGNATNVSAMRSVLPREAGIEQPKKIFWPFLDGFEQGIESWRALADGAVMSVSTEAKNGKAALSIRIATARRSATVGTTRLRGWFAQEHQARGFGFWARTKQGTGEVRCSLVANAFTTNQVIAAQERATKLTAMWKRVEVPFNDFTQFPLGELDLVTFEFTGTSSTEFLLDDLFLAGRWRFE
jgi:hypothetical protein